MSQIYVLVKDYGRDGTVVCGVCNTLLQAQTWAAVDSVNAVCFADLDCPPDPYGLSLVSDLSL